MTDRRRRCHVEVKGGVTSDGILTGAMDQTANCCPRQRNTPIQTQPRVMKLARRSQIPKPTPMSAIVIKAKICHRRLTSTLTNYRSSESPRAAHATTTTRRDHCLSHRGLTCRVKPSIFCETSLRISICQMEVPSARVGLSYRRHLFNTSSSVTGICFWPYGVDRSNVTRHRPKSNCGAIRTGGLPFVDASPVSDQRNTAFWFVYNSKTPFNQKDFHCALAL
jgi:hypothetical protein